MREKWKQYRLTVLLLVLALAAGCGIGSVAAKYIYSETLSAKVVFTAELADEFLFQEHLAVRQKDGSFVLSDVLLPAEDDEGNVINGNSYELLPGLDVPKDPFVTVVKKTPIDAYMYFEVIENLNSAITYTPDIGSDTTPKGMWRPLTDANGNQITHTHKDGKVGEVYVYTGGGDTAAVVDETFPETPVYLLKGGAKAIVTVSDSLLAADAEKTGEFLTFYAYLYEIGKDNNGVSWDALKTFTENQNQNQTT